MVCSRGGALSPIYRVGQVTVMSGKAGGSDIADSEEGLPGAPFLRRTVVHSHGIFV